MNIYFIYLFSVWTTPTTSPCHYTTGIMSAVESNQEVHTSPHRSPC